MKNRKFDELWKKANSSVMHQATDNPEDALENFANLIVKNCAAVCESRSARSGFFANVLTDYFKEFELSWEDETYALNGKDSAVLMVGSKVTDKFKNTGIVVALSDPEKETCIQVCLNGENTCEPRIKFYAPKNWVRTLRIVNEPAVVQTTSNKLRQFNQCGPTNC